VSHSCTRIDNSECNTEDRCKMEGSYCVFNPCGQYSASNCIDECEVVDNFCVPGDCTRVRNEDECPDGLYIT
jgi:hypothetical protein